MAVEAPVPWDKVTTLDGIESDTSPPPLNILIIGSGPFASDTLAEILEDGHHIVGVGTPKDRDGKSDPLKTSAKELGISNTFNQGELQKESFADEISSMKPDLIIGANLTATIKPHVYNSAPAGMIAFHPSFLPEYKGRNAINEQLIDGAERYGNPYPDTDLFGLTCYRIEDDGDPSKLDSGRIIGQVMIEDPNHHNAGSIYREVLADIGVRLMRDSVRKIANEYAEGKVYSGEEQSSEGSYDYPHTKQDAQIDWNKSAEEIDNLIRGSQNTPGAWTKFEGLPIPITLFDSSKVYGPTLNPGKVTIDDNGMTIEAGQGLVFVKTLQEEGQDASGKKKPRMNPFAYTHQNGNDLSHFEAKSQE